MIRRWVALGIAEAQKGIPPRQGVQEHAFPHCRPAQDQRCDGTENRPKGGPSASPKGRKATSKRMVRFSGSSRQKIVTDTGRREVGLSETVSEAAAPLPMDGTTAGAEKPATSSCLNEAPHRST
jgi:hypothetical protein